MSITPTPVSVWWDAPADGPTNMALDEALADEACRRGGVLVRVSTWARAEVSLGAFQRVADARACPSLAGLPIARRPSGGGAIVHGSDVTLAIAVPRGHALAASPQTLYDAAHRAMVEELAARGVPALRWSGAGAGADPPDGPLLCFDRRSPGDVVVAAAGTPRGDRKILGSAQRRLRGAVLQHGSLLLAANGGVGDAARHAGLEDLFPGAGPWRLPGGREVIGGWLRRLAASLGGGGVEQADGFRPTDAPAFEEAMSRYRSAAWIDRR
jgi:lipoate-protein ligase A